MNEIYCVKCGETDPKMFYLSHIKKPDRRCKKCTNEANKIWLKNHPGYASRGVMKWQNEHREKYNLYMKKWRQKNKERFLTTREKYRKNNMDKAAAQSLAWVNHPISEKCSIEGCNQVGERHHPNYNKPKDIIWLCRAHHKKLHRLLKEAEKIVSTVPVG